MAVRRDRAIPSPDIPSPGQNKPTDRSPERPRLGVLSIGPAHVTLITDRDGVIGRCMLPIIAGQCVSERTACGTPASDLKRGGTPRLGLPRSAYLADSAPAAPPFRCEMASGNYERRAAEIAEALRAAVDAADRHSHRSSLLRLITLLLGGLESARE